MKSTLYYVLDPMCSWCWGFRQVFETLLKRIPDHIRVQYVMGGLAPDSDQPMPEETRNYVQQQWRLVEKQTGAKFNWAYWEKCQPRRSTYPACRAVIAAGLQSQKKIPTMIHAIQKAYYLQARNPSDTDVLVALADEIDLDVEHFRRAINSSEVEQLLQQDFTTRRRLHANRFPSVLIEINNTPRFLVEGFRPAADVLEQLQAYSLLRS